MLLKRCGLQPERVLKKAKCPAAAARENELSCRRPENVLQFSKIPFSNLFKAFYLHLELPSDQQNKNGFAAERMWFLRHRVSQRCTFRYKIFYENFQNFMRSRFLRRHSRVRFHPSSLGRKLLRTGFSQTSLFPIFFRGGGVCTQVYFTLCPRNHNRSDAKPTCCPDRLVILNEDYLEQDFQTIRKRDFAEILEIF